MAIDDDPIRHLAIIADEDDVAAEMCVLKQNRTNLLVKGTYDYCVSVRDELVTNRGYTLPPYHQQEWTWNVPPNREPSSHDGLVSWFSPEYFHPETTATTLCLEMENRAAGADTIQNNTAKMPTLTTTAGKHRGLAVLDFDGSNDAMYINDLNDWSIAASANFMCTVMVHGPHNLIPAIQHIIQKGSKYELTLDYTGTNRNAVLNYNDGTTAGTLTISGGGTLSSTSPTIYTFGRTGAAGNNKMFLRLVGDNSLRLVESGKYLGALTQSSNPKIGYENTAATGYNGEFVEMMFCQEWFGGVNGITDYWIQVMEGYLAHKYKKATEILPTDHTYYSEPPRLNSSSLRS